MALARNIQDPFTTEGLVVLQMLDFAIEYGDESLTPLQINKLVYIGHGWILGVFERPLIDNQASQIQAWKYGPVVVNVYHMLKSFGNSPLNIFDFYAIVSKGDVFYDASLFPKQGEIKPAILPKFKDDYPEVNKGLRWVYQTYTRYNVGQLITLTHQVGTPWHQCYNPNVLERLGIVNSNTHIPDTLIKSYYKRRIRQDN